MWLDQNITQKIAFAYEANIFYRIFEQVLSAKRVFQFPLQLPGYKVSKHFIVLFYIKF
jgi:hypothetical protein